MTKPKLLIILPAYNEDKIIGKVIDDIKKEIKNIKNIQIKILVINDGSQDKTIQISKRKKVRVLSHFLNRGLGGALATGLEYARLNNFDIALTFDSDGQHHPKDIKKTIKPILNAKADVVIGSRMLGQSGMPLDRKIINHISNLFTFILFGVWTTDSQSGFRVFNKKALAFIKPKTQGMEVSSEFFSEIKKHKLKFQEVPINVIYTKYSRKKGQNNLNSVKISARLIFRLFR